MLTPRMKAVLDFVGARLDKTGVCPKYDEICAALGIKSKGSVSRLLAGLEARGFIERIPRLRGAIRIRRQTAHPDPVMLAALVGLLVKVDCGYHRDVPDMVAAREAARAAIAGATARGHAP